MKIHHVQNTAVEPTLGQLWREIKCSLWAHQFFVPSGDYVGMPQSHCYRCGMRAPARMVQPGLPEWCEPNGAKKYDAEGRRNG